MPALPGGYVFQPVTPELLALLKRADSTLAKLIPILEKNIPKILKSRTAVGRSLNLTRLKFETAAKLRENSFERAIDTFILNHPVEYSTELLNQGRDVLLRAAWQEFNRLKVGEFFQLANRAGEHFGEWMFADIKRRGAR